MVYLFTPFYCNFQICTPLSFQNRDLVIFLFILKSVFSYLKMWQKRGKKISQVVMSNMNRKWTAIFGMLIFRCVGNATSVQYRKKVSENWFARAFLCWTQQPNPATEQEYRILAKYRRIATPFLMTTNMAGKGLLKIKVCGLINDVTFHMAKCCAEVHLLSDIKVLLSFCVRLECLKVALMILFTQFTYYRQHWLDE